MKPLSKALELRKSLHLRSSTPKRAYYNRLLRPKRLLQIIEKSQAPKTLLFEARRQYLVSVAAAFELFWRELLRVSIDAPRIDACKLEGLSATKVSLQDLAEVFRYGISLGELVSSAFSLQGTAQLNQTVSKLLGIDAFSQFRSYEITMKTWVPRVKDSEEYHKVCLGPEALKRSQYIDRCFEIRHDTVHNTGTRYSVKPPLIHRIEDANWFFNLTFGVFVESKFRELSR